MEKFDHNQYRKGLADDLRDLRTQENGKEKANIFLDIAQDTERYNFAKEEHKKEFSDSKNKQKIESEKDGYSTDVLNILNTAPKEIIELIKNKKYYHVTLLKLGEKILEDGMKSGERPIEETDLKYFENLYNKYSKNKRDQFFNYYIKTIDEDRTDGNRSVHISDYPNTKLYQVPESLKFYLANLHFLLDSKILNSEEQMHTQQLFDKYYESIKSDKVAVLEIDAIDPSVLNSVLGGFDNLDLSNPKDIDIIKTTIKFPNPNIQVKGEILPKHIKLKEEQNLNIEDLDTGIKNGGFIIF